MYRHLQGRLLDAQSSVEVLIHTCTISSTGRKLLFTQPLSSEEVLKQGSCDPHNVIKEVVYTHNVIKDGCYNIHKAREICKFA